MPFTISGLTIACIIGCLFLFFIIASLNFIAVIQMHRIMTLFISTEDTAQDVIYKLGIEVNEDVDLSELEKEDTTDSIYVTSKEVCIAGIESLKEGIESQKKGFKIIALTAFITLLLALVLRDCINEYWSETKIAKKVINTIYTTNVDEMEDTWITLKPMIDSKVQYQLDMTKFENLVQRHQGINSKDTTIDFTFNKSKDDTLLVYYTIHTPLQKATYNRLAIISFKNNKIIDFKEYDMDTIEDVVKYF